MERFRTLCSSAVFLPCGLRAEPDCPASLDMDRRHSDSARKLERRLDLGSTEHSFSLALIRLARPYVQMLVQRHGWAAFVLLVSTFLAVLPVAAKIVDYGAEGWLWALFGLYQRQYVDGISAVGSGGETQRPSASALAATQTAGLMRLLACLVAAVVFVWQEQKEFSFPAIHLAVVILGLGVLSVSLCLFKRGESRIQPPEKIASTLRFIGRYTLEIYAIQLAGSELIVKLAPDLAT